MEAHQMPQITERSNPSVFKLIKDCTIRIVLALGVGAVTFIPTFFFTMFASVSPGKCGTPAFCFAIGLGGLAAIFFGGLTLIFGEPWKWHEQFESDKSSD
jgi:hypothetical protein